MNRVGIAFRAFFAALGNAAVAERLRTSLDGPAMEKSTDVALRQLPAPRPAAPVPGRSEAITLLAALQREARLIDLIKQPLNQFSDEQIGGAARNILADSAACLDRFFGLAAVAPAPEGAEMEVPQGYDAAVYKLSGPVSGSGPFCGTVVHQGWKATANNMPVWSGSKAAALVIAPVEVEIGSS
jgi:hypothetical protein